MKKVFVAFALSVIVAASYGCAANANSSADTTNTANSANSNANVATANIAETPNADAPQPLPEEVPVFTDAKEALETGKKYFVGEKFCFRNSCRKGL